MAGFSTLTISYISAYTNGIASAQTTAAVAIPSGIDYSQAVRNIKLAGGQWITNSSGNPQFIPWNQITGIAVS